MNSRRRIAAIIMSLVILFLSFDAFDFSSKAANGLIQVVTTKECSLWITPATQDAYRIQKLPPATLLTVYSTPVASLLGDGKTFYMTNYGFYVLCNCVIGEFGDPALNNLKKNPYKFHYYSKAAIHSSDMQHYGVSFMPEKWKYTSNIWAETKKFFDEYNLTDYLKFMVHATPVYTGDDYVGKTVDHYAAVLKDERGTTTFSFDVNYKDYGCTVRVLFRNGNEADYYCIDFR